MKLLKLDDMTKGWFVGNFTPTAFSTEACEVACKKYKAGDYEERHFHKIATEITAILKGNVTMNGKKYKEGDVIVIEPGEATDFKAESEVVNLVVKIPSAKGDKYII